METSYKEKYEQALAKAKEQYNYPCMRSCMGILEEIFPGLVENKDERIRKALKQYFVNSFQNNGVAAICGVHVKDVLAWLEKQGQVKESTISQHENRTCEENCNSLTYEDERIRKAIKVCLIYCNSINQIENDVFNDCIAWLEKQSKQKKDILEDAILDGYTLDDDEDGLIAETIRYKKEKQGEKKPADKVEPKFKIGDFIVNDYCMGRIVEITNDAYLLDTGQGIPFSCEHNAHLWTIQDAKDGDVLCLYYNNRKTFFIFKAIIGEGDYADILVHCCYTGKYQYLEPSFNGECRMHQISDGGYCIPADKEEQGILFQKMKEAGYEWDAEKKELKKIEQKPTDNEMKTLLRTEYEKGRADAIAEMQIAWSKEDEKILRTIISDGIRGAEFDMVQVNWLKNLKGIYTWRPSDEQMGCLSDAIEHYNSLGYPASKLKELLDDLKKLKEGKV